VFKLAYCVVSLLAYHVERELAFSAHLVIRSEVCARG